MELISARQGLKNIVELVRRPQVRLLQHQLVVVRSLLRVLLREEHVGAAGRVGVALCAQAKEGAPHGIIIEYALFWRRSRTFSEVILHLRETLFVYALLLLLLMRIGLHRTHVLLLSMRRLHGTLRPTFMDTAVDFRPTGWLLAVLGPACVLARLLLLSHWCFWLPHL